MDILLNGEVVEELSSIVHRSKLTSIARNYCSRLLDIIPRQQFKISIQAAVKSHIIARENIKPYRKDVTSKIYGGDVTRKQKVLRRQAEAKRKMRIVGNVQVPRDTFMKLLKR